MNRDPRLLQQQSLQRSLTPHYDSMKDCLLHNGFFSRRSHSRADLMMMAFRHSGSSKNRAGCESEVYCRYRKFLWCVQIFQKTGEKSETSEPTKAWKKSSRSFGKDTTLNKDALQPFCLFNSRPFVTRKSLLILYDLLSHIT